MTFIQGAYYVYTPFELCYEMSLSLLWWLTDWLTVLFY